MNIRKISTYSLALFLIALMTNLFGSWQAPVPKFTLFGLSVFYALVLTIPSAVSYYFGVNLSKSIPTIGRTIFCAFFTYFFSYSACLFFGLFEISWYIFMLVSIIVAFLAGLRFSANKSLQPTAKDAAG